MTRRRYLLAGMAAQLAGCFSPTVEDGHLQCEPKTNACPPGFHCAVDGTCWSDGREPSVDLAAADRATDLALPDLGAMARDVGAPDVAWPDLASVDLPPPDLAAPDLGTDDLPAPDLAAPDSAAPDFAAPDLAAPDSAAPDLAAPDSAAPDFAQPDLLTPDLAQLPQLVQSSLGIDHGGTFTLTFPNPTTSGTLLVATFAEAGTVLAPTFPANWKLATSTQTLTDFTGIWYYPNNLGGIKNVTITVAVANNSTRGQLSEWQGVTMVDQTGSGTTLNAGNLTVTTAGASTGPIAITVFAEKFTLASPVTFTKGGGWSNLGNDELFATNFHMASDYLLPAPAGKLLSETESTGTLGSWLGVIATFK